MENTQGLAGEAREINPAFVYVSRLTKTGRPAVENMLRLAARWMAETEGFPTAGFETIPWHRMKVGHVTSIRKRAIEKGYSPSSVNLMLSAIRGTARAAWRGGLMTAEDLMRIIMVGNVESKPKPSGRRITAGELSALIENIDTTTQSGKRDAAVISLAYCTGMRRREISLIRMENISDAEKNMEIRIPKRGRTKSRTLHLDNGGADAVRDYIEARGRRRGPLFVTSRKSGALLDEPLGEHGVYEIVKRCGDRAGFALTPHDFRLTFVSHLLDQGADLAVVAGMAGHSNVQTTKRYAVGDGRARKAAVKLPPFPYRKTRRVP